MPAQSEKQRRAMAAELQRRREGKNPSEFKDMSLRQLRDFAEKVEGKR